MPKQTLDAIGSFLAVHFIAMYIFLLICFFGPSGSRGSIVAPFQIAWMFLPIGYVVSLPFVLPCAMPLIAMIQRRPPPSRTIMLAVGGLCGICAVSLMEYLLLPFYFADEFPVMLVAAAVAGMIGGWLLFLSSRAEPKGSGN